MNDTIIGKTVGNIHIDVFETADKKPFFYLRASDKNLLPVLDFLDNSLTNYKTIN